MLKTPTYVLLLAAFFFGIGIGNFTFTTIVGVFLLSYFIHDFRNSTEPFVVDIPKTRKVESTIKRSRISNL